MSSPRTRIAAALTSALPQSPREITELRLEPYSCLASTIDAFLVCPAIITLVLTLVPSIILAERPLEVELEAVGRHSGMTTVQHCLSTHAHLWIIIGAGCAPVSARVVVHRSGNGWIARALIHPSSWADATTVTVVSLALGGLPLPSDCLPATLRVGYNHALSLEGEVFVAAKAGNAPALQAALDAGGSTEEANEVREERGPCLILVFSGRQCVASSQSLRLPAVLHCIDPTCSTPAHPTARRRLASLRFSWLLTEATSRLSASSWRQAPIRLQQTR